MLFISDIQNQIIFLFTGFSFWFVLYVKYVWLNTESLGDNELFHLLPNYSNMNLWVMSYLILEHKAKFIRFFLQYLRRFCTLDMHFVCFSVFLGRYVSCSIGCPVHGLISPSKETSVENKLHDMGCFEIF